MGRRFKIDDFHNYKRAVICQADGDMGDGLQRTSMYLIGKALLGEPDDEVFQAMNKYLWSEKIARPIRDPLKWTNPNDVSRDQEDPYAIMLHLYNVNLRVVMLARDRYIRFGRNQNADISGPIQISNDIRMSRIPELYPLLYLFDVGYVIGASIDVAKAWLHHGKDGPWLDMDNAITRLAFTDRVWPTLWTKLTWIIYRLFPTNLGGAGIIGALKWKHRIEAGANPAMAELWSLVLRNEHRRPFKATT